MSNYSQPQPTRHPSNLNSISTRARLVVLWLDLALTKFAGCCSRSILSACRLPRFAAVPAWAVAASLGRFGISNITEWLKLFGMTTGAGLASICGGGRSSD